MRYPIWKKDDTFYPNTPQEMTMDASVVDLTSDIIPVAWGFNWDREPLGRVFDIRLEDGEITAELMYFNAGDQSPYDEQYAEMFERGEIRLGGYYTDVERYANTVTKCTLKGVSIIPELGFGANPGVKL